MGLRKNSYQQTNGGDEIPVELFQILKDDAVKVLYSGMLECEVKWALESTAMNKATRGDGIPAELSQIQKMML